MLTAVAAFQIQRPSGHHRQPLAGLAWWERSHQAICALEASSSWEVVDRGVGVGADVLAANDSPVERHITLVAPPAGSEDRTIDYDGPTGLDGGASATNDVEHYVVWDNSTAQQNRRARVHEEVALDVEQNLIIRTAVDGKRAVTPGGSDLQVRHFDYGQPPNIRSIDGCAAVSGYDERPIRLIRYPGCFKIGKPIGVFDRISIHRQKRAGPSRILTAARAGISSQINDGPAAGRYALPGHGARVSEP